MESELAAQVALVVYATIAAGIVVWQVLRCGIGWQAWLLYAIQRTYGGIVFHWRSDRRCPFPEAGPALIIANHRSPVDPMMVWMNHHLNDGQGRIRVISFLMAREYYEATGLRWISKHMRSIPIERGRHDTGAVRVVLRKLKAGDLVGVFPEGRINVGDRLHGANTGIAWLALTAKVLVYPVFIHDAPQGKSMIEPFCRLSRVRVSYGEPIDLSELFGRKKTQKLLKEVTELLMHQLADLGGCAVSRI